MNTQQETKILMYHGIIDGKCPLPDDREIGADLYDLPVVQFERHMAFLKEQGYSISHLEGRASAASKQITITFDDGELNNYQIALPILKKFSYSAYFFIIVGRVGKKGYMSWEQIKALHEQGMIIGSHGLSHQILTSLMDTQIDEELRASKRTMEVNLNIKIETLSIPRGFCNDTLIKKACELGYKTIFISDRPDDLTNHCYSRIAVKSRWTVKHLADALAGKRSPMESFFLSFKKLTKNLLKEDVYNRARSILIKIFRY